MATTRVARRGLPAAIGRTALGAGAASAVTHAAPVAQATSERLALTVAALIAVAVLAVLGGLVVLLFRRQAQAEDEAGLAPAPEVAGSGESLWSTPPANGSSAGSVRAGAADDEDGPDDDSPADASGPADDATPMEPMVLPPDPQEPWTAEITWVAHKTRFRVVAHRGGDLEGAPVALAQTEALPWPPKDDASVQALAEASGTLESVLLDSGWTALPAGATWYSKRFAWEPQPALDEANGAGDPGRFEREAVAQDADAPHR